VGGGRRRRRRRRLADPAGSRTLRRGATPARAGAYGIDEVVVLTWTYHQADRRRSYEFLAAAARGNIVKKQAKPS